MHESIHSFKLYVNAVLQYQLKDSRANCSWRRRSNGTCISRGRRRPFYGSNLLLKDSASKDGKASPHGILSASLPTQLTY